MHSWVDARHALACEQHVDADTPSQPTAASSMSLLLLLCWLLLLLLLLAGACCW
jgi:hypothetical protein